jgi:hypothetical protein
MFQVRLQEYAVLPHQGTVSQSLLTAILQCLFDVDHMESLLCKVRLQEYAVLPHQIIKMFDEAHQKVKLQQLAFGTGTLSNQSL